MKNSLTTGCSGRRGQVLGGSCSVKPPPLNLSVRVCKKIRNIVLLNCRKGNNLKDKININELLAEHSKQVTIVNQLPQILKPDHPYPYVIHGINISLEMLLRNKQLLLPNIKFYDNKMLYIFSDYGGEHDEALYSTYSFLFASYDSLLHFEKSMTMVRDNHKLGKREISSKKLRDKLIQKALPDYLTALNNTIVGLFFTVIIDKNVESIISNDTDRKCLQEDLQNKGYEQWNQTVVDKLISVLHIISYFIALFTEDGMGIFWMSDEDAIMPNNPRLYNNTYALLKSTLHQYTNNRYDPFVFALPFKEKDENGKEIIASRDIMTMDALSCPDIVAGAIEQYYSRTQLYHRGDISEDEIIKKDIMNTTLIWLTEQGIGLKKYAIRIGKKNDKLTVALVFFESKENLDSISHIQISNEIQIVSMDLKELTINKSVSEQ